MVVGAIAGNMSAQATTPTGNSFAEAMRGCLEINQRDSAFAAFFFAVLGVQVLERAQLSCCTDLQVALNVESDLSPYVKRRVSNTRWGAVP